MLTDVATVDVVTAGVTVTVSTVLVVLAGGGTAGAEEAVVADLAAVLDGAGS